MVLGNTELSEEQKKRKRRMEKRASRKISEVSESNHALEDSEQILDNLLNAGEYEKAGKVFRELKALKINSEKNGFEQEAKKWSEIIGRFKEKAKEIQQEKKEECRSEIEEAKQLENKIHENIVSHEAAEGISGAPLRNEFKAVKRDLIESKSDIKDIIMIARKFNLDEETKEDAHELEIEWNNAKRTLEKLES
jgi:hypothetical protein